MNIDRLEKELAEEVTRILMRRFSSGHGLACVLARQMTLDAMKWVGRYDDIPGPTKKHIVLTSVHTALLHMKESNEWYRNVETMMPFLSDYVDDLIAVERNEIRFTPSKPKLAEQEPPTTKSDDSPASNSLKRWCSCLREPNTLG